MKQMDRPSETLRAAWKMFVTSRAHPGMLVFRLEHEDYTDRATRKAWKFSQSPAAFVLSSSHLTWRAKDLKYIFGWSIALFGESRNWLSVSWYDVVKTMNIYVSAVIVWWREVLPIFDYLEIPCEYNLHIEVVKEWRTSKLRPWEV